MDEWLKRGSLKRKHEEDTPEFGTETEDVTDSSSSNSTATSYQITRMEDVKISQSIYSSILWTHQLMPRMHLSLGLIVLP
jgi:hypothetical protein